MGARRQAVLVLTDPAGHAAYREQAQELAEFTRELDAAKRLDDILGSKASDLDPIGGEAAQVILRRLFDQIDNSAAEVSSAEYYNAYQRVSDELPDALPPGVASLDYARLSAYRACGWPALALRRATR